MTIINHMVRSNPLRKRPRTEYSKTKTIRRHQVCHHRNQLAPRGKCSRLPTSEAIRLNPELAVGYAEGGHALTPAEKVPYVSYGSIATTRCYFDNLAAMLQLFSPCLVAVEYLDGLHTNYKRTR